MSTAEHKSLAESHRLVRCAVITVSDTRTEASDKSGSLIRTRLLEGGHEVVFYRIVPDEPAEIRALLPDLVGRVDAILLSGGTGISRRDNTYEAVTSLLEKTIPGFGELFRMLSYEEVGAASMLSRATAGVYQDVVVFSTPGSVNAVRLALDKLILPELKHLVWEIARMA